MILGVKKFSIFLVITFGLMLMSLVLPQNQVYAGNQAVVDKLYDFLTGDGNIEDELFMKVIEDTVKDNINVVGFETHRFETEEQAAKFRAAVVEQQVKNLIEDLKNASLVDKAQIILNLKDHLSSNLQKSVDQVNKLIEEKGGNIDAVILDMENKSIFGINIGKTIINMFKDVTPDEYTQLRKLDEQLKQEAYAELGVSGLPQNILDGLFKLSNNQETFWENFKNMSQSDKDWFEKTKTYYAYSVELTDDAVALMEATGLSSLEELTQFYMNNQHRIKNMNDLKSLANRMAQARKELLDLLNKHAQPIQTKNGTSNSLVKGDYVLTDTGILKLYASVNSNYPNVSLFGVYGGLQFDSAESYTAFLIALEKFKQEFNWDFTASSPDDIQKLYIFYQNSPDDLNEPIKLAGKAKIEYHTFVSKVVFRITKKKGSTTGINMQVADMATLNELALKYNPKFAPIYKRLTGNASPAPKVTKSGNSIIVELDYYGGIEKNNARVYDAIRNNWSLIRGEHNRPSLDYHDFIPTLALTNVTDGGVYEIEAIIYGSRFYQYEDFYTRYVGCSDDENGHHHGSPQITSYFPYRQEVRDYVHGLPRTNDQRNIRPDYIVKDKVIGKAVWEVNVKAKGKIIIPPLGVKNTDVSVSNIISQ